MTATSPPGPLAGVTVVALEQAVSAPICSRTLADFGARVIKIESPAGGDFTRHYDSVVNGQAAHFVWLNRNKESVALDLRSKEGIDIMHRLLGRADVFISNLSPGATTRLGLGAEQLRARHPHIVSLEINGYGLSGPLSHKRAYDLLVQAESGACSITGWPGQPAKPGPPVADVATGLYGAITILAMLHGRAAKNSETAHGGRHATVSMFDTMIELMGFALTHARYSRTDSQPVGMGSPAVAPYSAYQTSDNHIVVLGTTNNTEWSRLANLVGRPDLVEDPRYRNNQDRVAHRNELDELIGAWCAERTLTEIQALADHASIGNARYNTVTDVITHPQLQERGRWMTFESPTGPVTGAAPPPIINGYTNRSDAIPAIGEHTDPILRELKLKKSKLEGPSE